MVGVKMAFSGSRLTLLQKAITDAFFARESSFFLTGGGALAGYYLGHRETDDLDLFTTEESAFERGRHALGAAAAAVGASLEIKQSAPGFVRALLQRGDEQLMVDLVHDRSAQRVPTKMVEGEVRLDPPEEIVANKLAAVVGRQEPKDLIDLFFLAGLGLLTDDALRAAHDKDGGCTPATLAWLLDSFPLPREDRLPASVSLEELAAWRAGLVKRLRRLALP